MAARFFELIQPRPARTDARRAQVKAVQLDARLEIVIVERAKAKFNRSAAATKQKPDPASGFRRCRAALRCALTAAVLQSTAGARADNGCTGAPRSEPANRARVEAVNERLELTLDDGRILRLAGLDPPRPTPDDPDLDQRGSARLAGALVGGNVTVRLLDTRRDRWGRLPAEAYAAQGAADPVSVAKTAIEAGLARFEPESSPRACRAALLAAESAARGAGLGLWADPYYAVLTTADHDAFAERAGSTIIVQGRVANVERNAYRTTLLFGARRGADFSVTILQRNIKQFIASGLDPEGLKGRTIRIRGLLDTRFGPQIEAANPDAIEALPLETEAGPPGTARQ